MTYAQLQVHLSRINLGTYFQNDDLLVVSSSNPASPQKNSFWLRKRDERWFLGTWLPAIYEIPVVDIGAVCKALYDSSETAIYTVDCALAKRFALRKLSEAEIVDLKL